MIATPAERGHREAAPDPGGWRAVLVRWRRSPPSEETVLLVTALAVGISTGLGAVAFVWLLDAFQWLFLDWLRTGLEARVGRLGLVAIPALGGLVAGPLIVRFAREAKGHGVPEVMQAIALRGGRIAPQVVVVKAVASAACIGSGGSAGREGPIVQIGSAIGSVLGQALRFSDARIRNLVACGSAAGIAAVFNAPIAGAMFAMEVILGEFTTRYFGTVVVAAVAASIVAHRFLGQDPAMGVPEFQLVSPWELVAYALLGLAAALVAWAFVASLYWFEDRFDGWAFPDWLKPAVGGLLLGVLALGQPMVLGSGLEVIERVIGGDVVLAWQALAVLVVAKMLATDFTLGSGNSGGVFAPSLFMGAALGAAFGTPLHALLPDLTAPAGAYALVGMSAVFAAASHAPITAVMVIFEMSGDYGLILPLMLATVISTLVSERLRRESIYTLKLKRRGIVLEAGRIVDVMRGVLVSEAMDREVATVAAAEPIGRLLQRFREAGRRGLPVVDADGLLAGIVTVQDLERANERDVPEDTPVGAIAVRDVLVTYPDETIADAQRRMNARDVERLPVLSRETPGRIVGVLRRRDVIRAYNIALVDRAETQQRVERLRVDNLDQTTFVEVEIADDAPGIGRTLAELAPQLPHQSVIVSVRRASGQVLIPHGSTEILAGDHVVAFAEAAAIDEVRRVLAGPAGPPS